jgi:malate dehydrogenase
MKKVSIIGAGHVGATAGLYLLEKKIADVVLIDIVEGLPQGKAMDISHAAPLRNYLNTITGSNDYAAISGSDVIVITAGLPRKPGMSRADLLATNARIVGGVAEQVKTYAPNAVVIVVTNPLDVICHVVKETTGFPRERVIGMAGVLDSTRFRLFIAEELGVHLKDVVALVMGGHGDDMVPLPRYTSVSGISISELLSQNTIERLVARTRTGGGEIVGLLKEGSAFYAPASSIAEMAETILLNIRRILPVSAYLEGEYGLKGVYVGVPAILGENGMERVVELALTYEERNALHTSAGSVTKSIAQWEAMKEAAA